MLIGEENKNKTCGGDKTNSKSHTTSILAAILSVFGVAILLALFILFLYPKLKLTYQLHKAKIRKYREENGIRFNRKGRKNDKRVLQRSTTEEEELQIEKTPNMELYTQVGKFVVNM